MDSLSQKKFLSSVESHKIPDGFIKVADSPLATLTSAQKAALNRKGNELFNCGRVDEASRIFLATGYSDGLTRVGDSYEKKNKSLEALRFYFLAKNKRKTGPICEKIASIISLLLKES